MAGNKNSGRRPQSKEIALIKKLSKYSDEFELALMEQVRKGNVQALSLYRDIVLGKNNSAINIQNNIQGVEGFPNISFKPSKTISIDESKER